MEVRRTTTATPEQVWAALSDLDGWPSWLPTVDTLTRVDADRPHEVGAEYVLKQPKLPKARWVITRWEPGRRFDWTSRAPGVTSVATHTLTPTDGGGTEIVLTFDWRGPFSGLTRLMWGRLAKQYVETEAASLAERAEA